MPLGKLKVAFLIGRDDDATRRCVEAVSRLEGIELSAVLLDTERAGWRKRFRNLRRNVRANGWRYLLVRAMGVVRDLSDRAVRRTVVNEEHVRDVLRRSFPNRNWSVAEAAAKHGAAVKGVGNLNSPAAAQALRDSGADLGIVVGTRVLKPTTFGVPPLGCINLHKGKVPEYRGLPPGFWELHDGATEAGVTVHCIDARLDTGDIVAESRVPISCRETPESLLEKLDEEGATLLAHSVALLRDGKVVPRPQESLQSKPRTRPTLAHVTRLQSQLPHCKSKNSDLSRTLRNLYSLGVYYSGLYAMVRWLHRRSRSRAVIMLYHRVNDFAKDALTVDCETFAAQLIAIGSRYSICTTAELLESLKTGASLAPSKVLIHFDDCYRDIFENGAPILRELKAPACAFISTGFVDSHRTFEHDATDSPFRFPMLRREDLRAWVDMGFEVGAHTVNHVNLGQCVDELAEREIVDSGNALEELTGTPVRMFSFPFGQRSNISEHARNIVAQRYHCLFSAYGGVVEGDIDLFDIPRVGASGEKSPLYCLLQLEGLAPAQLAERFKSLKSFLLLRGSPARQAPV